MLAQLEKEAGVDKITQALESGELNPGDLFSRRATAQPRPASASGAQKRTVDLAAAALGFQADATIASAAARARGAVSSESSLRDAILSGQGGSVREGLEAAAGGGPRTSSAGGAAMMGMPGEMARLLRMQRDGEDGASDDGFDAPGVSRQAVETTAARRRRGGGQVDRSPRLQATSARPGSATLEDGGDGEADEAIDVMIDGKPASSGRDAAAAAGRAKQPATKQPSDAAGGRRKPASQSPPPPHPSASGKPAPKPLKASQDQQPSKPVKPSIVGGRRQLEELMGLHSSGSSDEVSGSGSGSETNSDFLSASNSEDASASDGVSGSGSGSDAATDGRREPARRSKRSLFAYSDESDAGADVITRTGAIGPAPPSLPPSSRWAVEDALEDEMDERSEIARGRVEAARISEERLEDRMLQLALTAVQVQGGIAAGGSAAAGLLAGAVGSGPAVAGGSPGGALVGTNGSSPADVMAALTAMATQLASTPSVRASSFEGILAAMDDLRGAGIPDSAVPETEAYRPRDMGPQFAPGGGGAPDSVQRGIVAIRSLRARAALLTAQRVVMSSHGSRAALTPQARQLAIDRARQVEAALRAELTHLELDSEAVDAVTADDLAAQHSRVRRALRENRRALVETLAGPGASLPPTLSPEELAVGALGGSGAGVRWGGTPPVPSFSAEGEDAASSSPSLRVVSAVTDGVDALAGELLHDSESAAARTLLGGRLIDAESHDASTSGGVASGNEGAPMGVGASAAGSVSGRTYPGVSVERPLSSHADDDFGEASAAAASLFSASALSSGSGHGTADGAGALALHTGGGDGAEAWGTEASLEAMAQAQARALDDASRGTGPGLLASMDETARKQLARLHEQQLNARLGPGRGTSDQALASRDAASDAALAAGGGSYGALAESERRDEERYLLKQAGVFAGVGSAAARARVGDGIRGTSSYTGVGTLQDALAAEEAAKDAVRRRPTVLTRGQLEALSREKEKALDAVGSDPDALAAYLIAKADEEDAAERALRTGLKPGAVGAVGAAGARAGEDGMGDADSDVEEEAVASKSLIPAGFRSWAEVTAVHASKPKRVARAKAQLAADRSAKLKLMIKPPTPAGGAPPSARMVRVQAQVARVLETVLARRAVRDPDLYPAGAPIEVTDVTVTPDLRTAYVRWVLPVPLTQDGAWAAALTGGRGRPALSASSANGAQSLLPEDERRNAGSPGYAVNTASFAERLMQRTLAEREVRAEKRRRAAEAAADGGRKKTTKAQRAEQEFGDDARLDHLPLHVAALANTTASALARHEKELRRAVGVELALQFVPKLEFHRHVAAELQALGEAGVVVAATAPASSQPAAGSRRGRGGFAFDGQDDDDGVGVTLGLQARAPTPRGGGPAKTAAATSAPNRPAGRGAAGWKRVGMTA